MMVCLQLEVSNNKINACNRRYQTHNLTYAAHTLLCPTPLSSQTHFLHSCFAESSSPPAHILQALAQDSRLTGPPCGLDFTPRGLEFTPCGLEFTPRGLESTMWFIFHRFTMRFLEHTTCGHYGSHIFHALQQDGRVTGSPCS